MSLRWLAFWNWSGYLVDIVIPADYGPNRGNEVLWLIRIPWWRIYFKRRELKRLRRLNERWHADNDIHPAPEKPEDVETPAEAQVWLKSEEMQTWEAEAEAWRKKFQEHWNAVREPRAKAFHRDFRNGDYFIYVGTPGHRVGQIRWCVEEERLRPAYDVSDRLGSDAGDGPTGHDGGLSGEVGGSLP